MTFVIDQICADLVMDGAQAPVQLLPERLDEIFHLDPDVGDRVERVLRPGGRTPLVFVAHDAGELPTTGPAVGFLVASLREGGSGVGVVEMLGVGTHRRRRGIGRALLRAAEGALGALGARQVHVMGNAPVYAWPGVDLRHTAALALLEGAGYVRTREAVDMEVDLLALARSGAFDGLRGPDHGGGMRVVALRGTDPDDLALRAQVQGWVAEEFADGWRRELGEALDRGDRGRVAGAVVALRGDRTEPEVVGFAAYGAQRPALFGPMGTAQSARGTGIGSRLLLESLAAQHAAGLGWADIGWVGPAEFYARACGASVSRTYALLSKDLPPEAPSRG